MSIYEKISEEVNKAIEKQIRDFVGRCKNHKKQLDCKHDFIVVKDTKDMFGDIDIPDLYTSEYHECMNCGCPKLIVSLSTIISTYQPR